MEKNVFSLFCLVVVFGCCFAQSPDNSSISIGFGYGVDYGGLGGKVSIKPVENFGLVGGIGNYFGPPLSYGEVDDRLTVKNLKGLGFCVGIEFFYGSPYLGGGVHYIITGKYYNEKSLQGINWSMICGDVYFNTIPLFIHYGVNVTFILYNNGKNLGGIIGISLGIGYSFELSRSKKNVQTKHLKNL